MNDPRIIREGTAESAAQRVLGCFQAAHSVLNTLSKSDHSVALARAVVYLDQGHFNSAVHVLEEVLTPGEPDLRDLQEVYLRLLAMLTRHVSMNQNIEEAHANLTKSLQSLSIWAAAIGDGVSFADTQTAD